MKTLMKMIVSMLIIPSFCFAATYNEKKVSNKQATCLNKKISWCKQHPVVCKKRNVDPRAYCAQKHLGVAP